MGWKNLKFDNDVEISDSGEIRIKAKKIKLDDGRIFFNKVRYLHPRIYNGYLYIHYKNKMYAVHKLVAEHFVPNPHNSKIVSFKDGDSLNVDSTNLKWCNRHELMQEIRHSDRFNSGSGKSKSVYCAETDTVYPSIKECAIQLKKQNNLINYDTLARKLRQSDKITYLGYTINRY